MSVQKVVVLPHVMSGAELVRGVEIAVGLGRFVSLYHEVYADGTCELGQDSGYPYQRIVVAPDADSERIVLGDNYRAITLLEGTWPGGFEGGGGDPEEAMENFKIRLLLVC